MKRKILILVGALAIGAGVYSLSPSDLEKELSANTIQENFPVHEFTPQDLEKSVNELANQKLHIDTSYSDGVQSLDELKDTTQTILTGTVVEQVQFSPLSVVSTIKVAIPIKGDIFDTVEVFQLGQLPFEEGSEILKPNEEYLLFLGLQGDEGDNKFYIKGGVQGAFLNEKGKVLNLDPVLQASAQNIQGSQISENSQKSVVSEFTALVDSISKSSN